jgi:hypothetical protein
MATQNRSLEKATKNRGRSFGAPSEERVNSTALKSGVGGGECEATSMQIFVQFLPPSFAAEIFTDCTSDRRSS